MLRWLGRTPESFVPPAGRDDTRPGSTLPDPPPNHILRFDAEAMYSALDAHRRERGLTWTQVASEIGGVSAGSLTRLADGGRVGFPAVMRVTGWLGRPAASFTRISDW